jgi:hypothetical protein
LTPPPRARRGARLPSRFLLARLARPYARPSDGAARTAVVSTPTARRRRTFARRSASRAGTEGSPRRIVRRNGATSASRSEGPWGGMTRGVGAGTPRGGRARTRVERALKRFEGFCVRARIVARNRARAFETCVLFCFSHGYWNFFSPRARDGAAPSRGRRSSIPRRFGRLVPRRERSSAHRAHV